MRLVSLCSSRLTYKIIKYNFIKINLKRHASIGVRLWEEDISTDAKHKVEDYWRDKVNKRNNEIESLKEKFYVLAMFPYPSGMLHMGHVRVYTISDCIARYYRMKGRYVIHPIGWDAFGLPAENAAREQHVEPDKWTTYNIEKMREQLRTLGCSFDWERELTTCNPEYYKWTQELFLKLFDKNLVCQRQDFVNWDPVDQTVLAEEQVDENNKSWRSGANVEKKLLNQWFIKATVFSKSLLEGLDDPILKNWRDIIKVQRHWIGECNGTNFEFELLSDTLSYPKTLILWTDKAEFVEEAKFVAVTADSLLAKIEGSNEENNRKLNAKIINPFTKEELPIFVTSSIEFPPFRDNHLGIPCASDADANFCNAVGITFEPENALSNNNRQHKQLEILEKAKKWNIGGYPVSSKSRDWLISRQRYWGTPIPIIHCKACGVQPVPRDQLPVILPKINQSSTGHYSTLLEATEWLKTECPNCGAQATRETDTMDTFVDSSWYFMRFIDSNNEKEMFAKNKANDALPVDLYIGGKEHAALHLYYARLINHFLHSEDLVPTREPFRQLLVQGMVKGISYRVEDSGKYLKKHEVQKIGKKYVEKETGKPVVDAWEKMSKSKFNGEDPSEMFSQHGVDTTRLLILADAAPTSERQWSSATFPGILKWQHRLWITVRQFIKSRNELTSEELRKIPIGDKFAEEEAYMFDNRNFYAKGVTYNMLRSRQISVAITKLQGLTKGLRKASAECVARSREYERALAVQIIMLAPMAPHFASELWAGFCSAPHRLVNDGEIQWDKDVLQQSWPQVDFNYKLDLTVKVNSWEVMKLKFPRQMLDKMTSAEALQLVTKEPTFQDYLQDQSIINVNLYSEEGCEPTINIITENTTKKISNENMI